MKPKTQSLARALLASVWLMAPALQAADDAGDSHEFTSADGSKKFSATVVSASVGPDGKVTAEIRRTDDQRRMTVPASAFCDADRLYLAKHAALAATAKTLNLSLTPVTEKPGKASEESGRRISKTEARYDLVCRNNGAIPMEGVEVKYKVFVKREKRLSAIKGDKKDEVITGSFDLPLLSSKQQHVAKTNTIELVSDRPNLGGKGWSLSGGWKTTKPLGPMVDTVEGVIMQVMKEGRVIREIKHPSNLKRTWDIED